MIAPSSSRPPSARARILIVDGMSSVCHMLAELLERHGYATDLANSAREALLLAATGRWDAVLLDIGLPDMNGVELYTQLNANNGRECLPVIFVSGYTGQSLLESLQGERGISTLTKPFSVHRFLRTLEQSLRHDNTISA
ncbi:MAG: response regulator [Lacunisphaera sp.]